MWNCLWLSPPVKYGFHGILSSRCGSSNCFHQLRAKGFIAALSGHLRLRGPRSATHMDFEIWPNEVSNTCPTVNAAISPLDAPATATCSLNVGACVAWVEDQLPSAQLEILSHLHNIWAVMYPCLPNLWPTHMNATLDNAVTNFLNRREIL